jgi:hypothetical protein
MVELLVKDKLESDRNISRPTSYNSIVSLGEIKIDAIPKWSSSGSIQNAEFPEVGHRWGRVGGRGLWCGRRGRQSPRGSKLGNKISILNLKKT